MCLINIAKVDFAIFLPSSKFLSNFTSLNFFILTVNIMGEYHMILYSLGCISLSVSNRDLNLPHSVFAHVEYIYIYDVLAKFPNLSLKFLGETNFY